MALIWLFFVMTGIELDASVTVETVPKEPYQTYNTYVIEQASTPRIIGNNDWIQRQSSPPLISKFQVNPTTIVSISKFSGNIGSPLANLNRWRRQIGLPAVASDSEILDTTFLFGHGKLVSLENNGQYVMIIWLTQASNHFFVKVESSHSISLDTYASFINNQPWHQL